MPDREENLYNAKANDNPDLGFNYNELMDELLGELKIEDIKPGDVTAIELAKKTGLSRSYCCTVLNKKADRGELKRVKVRLPNGLSTVAFRKVE